MKSARERSQTARRRHRIQSIIAIEAATTLHAQSATTIEFSYSATLTESDHLAVCAAQRRSAHCVAWVDCRDALLFSDLLYLAGDASYVIHPCNRVCTTLMSGP
jgi:hypothetical protein